MFSCGKVIVPDKGVCLSRWQAFELFCNAAVCLLVGARFAAWQRVGAWFAAVPRVGAWFWGPKGPSVRGSRRARASVRGLGGQNGRRCVVNRAPTRVLGRKTTHRPRFSGQTPRTDACFHREDRAPTPPRTEKVRTAGAGSTFRPPNNPAGSTNGPFVRMVGMSWELFVRTAAAGSTFRPTNTPAGSTNGPFVRTVGMSWELFVRTASAVSTFAAARPSVRGFGGQNGHRCVMNRAPTRVLGRKTTHRWPETTHRPRFSGQTPRTDAALGPKHRAPTAAQGTPCADSVMRHAILIATAKPNKTPLAISQMTGGVKMTGGIAPAQSPLLQRKLPRDLSYWNRRITPRGEPLAYMLRSTTPMLVYASTTVSLPTYIAACPG